jgi:hypothetical protein
MSYPFRYEYYTLNDLRLIKFTHLESNKMGLYNLINNNTEFVLIYNNTPYIFINTPEYGFLYYFERNGEYEFFMDQHNKIYYYPTNNISIYIKKLYDITHENSIEDIFSEFNLPLKWMYCKVL